MAARLQGPALRPIVAADDAGVARGAAGIGPAARPRDFRGPGRIASHPDGAARQRHARESDPREQPHLDAVAGCQLFVVLIGKRPKLGEQPRHRTDSTINTRYACPFGERH